MAILTKSRLTALTETKLGTRMFAQVLNESKTESRANTTITVFLCHSHDDFENGDLDKIIVILRKAGVKVYIDSLDSSMPPFTNAETAKNIKEHIKLNKKFIMLASNKAINSKWCNWELGFGDAHKYIQNIALFPLKSALINWEGTEYLRIYPRIEESEARPEHFKVIFPDRTEKSLDEWLRF